MSKSLDIFRHFKKEIQGFNQSRLEEIFIKDLGKMWFVFSKMEKESFEMMGRAK